MNPKNPSLLFAVITCACLALLLVGLVGCAGTQKKSAAPDTAVPAPENSAAITKISVSEGIDTLEVQIVGDTLLTFTSVKQPSPLGVVLYFPKTRLKDADSEYPVKNEPVERVSVSTPQEADLPLRIEIALTQDVPYDILRENQTLKVVFPKPGKKQSLASSNPPPKAAEPVKAKDPFAGMPAPTHVESVTTQLIENGIQINVAADGPIKDYKAFTVEDPARIVFDIPAVKSPFNREMLIPVEGNWIKSVRYYGYPDKVRVVLDAEKAFLNAYKAEPVEKGLRIQVGDTVTAAKKEAAEVAAAKDQEPAWVNRIDFLSEAAGKSAVVVGTSRAVQHTLKKGPKNTLVLTLLNAQLPDFAKQPLITTRFESAVNRIIPVQTAEMKDQCVVNFELREAVPYRVEVAENEIRIHFDASTIPPKPLTVAELPDWKKVMEETAAAAEKETAGGPEAKRFTGEKIALDFYETDIKNVFRILKEVSGKNFAIDNDVTGKVTLSFDKPVPWDQIMDLVLKMNKLGKIEEGEIIRIAKLDTLVAIEKKIQERANEEPLVTKYIEANYIKAKEDALPLIEKIISKRGKIGVDSRTNQIVLTDIPQVIKRAEEIISRVDKVTPQVLIEGRFVRADITFRRRLGIDWTLSGGPIFKKFLGGQYDYNFGFNYPVPSQGSIGLSFQKFLGSPLDLDLAITAEEVNSNLSILSCPKVKTSNNQKAIMVQGVSYPYTVINDEGVPQIQFKEVELRLEVTPQITNDNRVSCLLVLKRDNILEYVAGPYGTLVPVVGINRTDTTLLVNDGDTIVVSGLVQQSRLKGETGFPWLSKIPILGWLFKAQNREDDSSELIIFITPKIERLESKPIQTRGTLQ